MIKVTIDAPEDIVDVDAYIAGAIKAVDDTVDDTLKDFNSSKKDFSDEHQFEFEVKKAKLENGVVSGSVGTDDENYCRLSEGFVIPAVTGKLMSFRPGYTAKTARGTIPSRRGGAHGPKIVRTKRKSTTVEGRQFDTVIHNANVTKFYKRVDEIGGKKNG